MNGTIKISSSSPIAKRVIPSSINIKGVTYKIHSISKNMNEALKERTAERVRGKKGTTKAIVIYVVYTK